MKQYDYDKDNIKNTLTINQIQELVAEFGGEPQMQSGNLVCKTICHAGDSHKLYYYENTHLFRCYTGGCPEPTFDIFELTRKIKSREYNKEWSLPEAIQYVAQYFGFSPLSNDFNSNELKLEDFEYLENYDRISNIEISTQIVELKTYDGGFLKNLPHPKIQAWIKEGITQEVMDYHDICYDPKNGGIVIPHYDIDHRLVGIRERTLIKENEIFGKYRPAKINKQLYNHPLSFNLYNIDNSKNNIRRAKKAFVFEGEKSCLLYASYFGRDNDISVACCGSNLIQYQAWLLMNQGVEEIIVCFDKQFQEVNDDEFKKLIRNLKQIHKKYGMFTKISFCFDKWDLLGYKDSPIDRGPETFLELYKRRVNLY